jgi:uncharacterized integral membrane protein
MSSDPSVPPSPDLPPPAGASYGPGAEAKFTKAAALWTALILGFLILIVLLIFIAQNTTSVAFAFLGWHWTLPLGVAILFAAVAGGLITVAVGAVRMFQLRRAARSNLKLGSG